MSNRRRYTSWGILSAFLFNTVFGPLSPAGAASAGGLGTPSLITSLPREPNWSVAGFQPPVLLGLKIHPENPLLFDFIVDQGASNFSQGELKSETEKLVKYFLAALTIPDKEVWVNLSPTEKDRIIPDVLGQTTMGKTMLEQDYILKQLASSLTNPDTDLGKKYWDEVNSAASPSASQRELNGRNDTSFVIASAESTRQSLNKVWILPDKAEVLESNGIVIIGEKRLKVMMDEEMSNRKDISESLATARDEEMFNRNGSSIKAFEDDSTSSPSAIFRSLILPNIEKEVNEGKNFADVRQIYNSVILAAWYKKALKESLLGKIYADKGKVAGVENDDKEMKQRIYAQYLEAFKKGVYNLIKEETDAVTGEMIPRKYFSGGVQVAEFGKGARSSLIVRAASPLEMTKAASSATIAATVQLGVDSIEVNAILAVSNRVKAFWKLSEEGARDKIYQYFPQAPLDSYTKYRSSEVNFWLKLLYSNPQSLSEVDNLKDLYMTAGDVQAVLKDKRFWVMADKLYGDTFWDEDDLNNKFTSNGYNLAFRELVMKYHNITSKSSAVADANASSALTVDEALREISEFFSPRPGGSINDPVIAMGRGWMKLLGESDKDTLKAMFTFESTQKQNMKKGEIQRVLRDSSFWDQAAVLSKRFSREFGRDGSVDDLLYRDEFARRFETLVVKFHGGLNTSASSGVNYREQQVRDFRAAVSANVGMRVTKALDMILMVRGQWRSIKENYLRTLRRIVQETGDLQNEGFEKKEKFLELAHDLLYSEAQGMSDSRSHVSELFKNNSDEFSAFYDLFFHKDLIELLLGSNFLGGRGDHFHRDLVMSVDQILSPQQKREFVNRYSSEFPTLSDFDMLKKWARQQDFSKTGSGKIWESLSKFTEEKIMRLTPVDQSKTTIRREADELFEALSDLLPGLRDDPDQPLLRKILGDIVEDMSLFLQGKTVDEIVATPMDYSTIDGLASINHRQLAQIAVRQPEKRGAPQVRSALARLGFEADGTPGEILAGPLKKALENIAASSGVERSELVGQALNDQDAILNAFKAGLLQAGDHVDVVFRHYDSKGNLMSRALSGKIAVINPMESKGKINGNTIIRVGDNGMKLANVKSITIVSLADSSGAALSAILNDDKAAPPVGGIDFDPTNMNLQIKRDGKGVPLPLPQQNLEQINIEGLFPVIINIVPVNAQTLPMFLGQAPQEPAREPESS